MENLFVFQIKIKFKRKKTNFWDFQWKYGYLYNKGNLHFLTHSILYICFLPKNDPPAEILTT